MAIPSTIESFLRGTPFTALTHRTAFTAQEEAAATHVPGREWAKTVCCLIDEHPVLAVLPANHRVDLERLRLLAGGTTARLATEVEMRGLYPECDTGAMPPLGPLYGQRVFIEQGLAADPEIVFHAGTHVDAVRMKYADLVALVQPVVGDFGRRL